MESFDAGRCVQVNKSSIWAPEPARQPSRRLDSSAPENVTALDISPEMLGIARRRAAGLGLGNITFLEGRAEEIPAHPAGLTWLGLMYVIDRATTAHEIARA